MREKEGKGRETDKMIKNEMEVMMKMVQWLWKLVMARKIVKNLVLVRKMVK